MNVRLEPPPWTRAAGIHVGPADAPLPGLAYLLLEIASRIRTGQPTAIVLPQTPDLAELTSVLVALSRLPADATDLAASNALRVFVPGRRIRSLVGHFVYEVISRGSTAGVSGAWLRPLNKGSSTTNAKFFAVDSDAVAFEPTSRKRPLGPASRPKLPGRAPCDLLSGAKTYGNTGLMKTRVVVLGSRASYERFLERTPISPSKSGIVLPCPPLSEHFCWGFLHESGEPTILSPDGAAGEPLVAVNRDPLNIRKGLGEGGCLLVSSDTSTVLRNVELMERFSENNAVLLLAEARRRYDVAELRNRGWTVWEPRPREMEVLLSSARETGVAGIDDCIKSYRADAVGRIAEMPCASPGLDRAFDLLDRVSDKINDEALENDAVADTMRRCRTAFFAAAGWFEFPSGDARSEYMCALDSLENPGPAFTLGASKDAAQRVAALGRALKELLAASSPSTPTPKGAALLRLARRPGEEDALRQVLLLGSGTARSTAADFLSRNGRELGIGFSGSSTGLTVPSRAVITNALGRDAFSRMVDPWPADTLMLLGYGFESKLYRSRLAARQRARERLRLDDETRGALTGIAEWPSEPAAARPNTSNPEPGFERLVRATEWNSGQRPKLETKPGDATDRGLFCRFVGHSWAAFTEEHQCLLLDEEPDGRTVVRRIELADLRVGHRILMREAGERDVVREIAEQLCGAERYSWLRDKADLWRRTLRSTGLAPDDITERLTAAGLRRNVETIRGWLRNQELIGPRNVSDVEMIGEVFATGISDAEWDSCCGAIHEVRRHHITAGTRLSGIITAQIGGLAIDTADREVGVGLDAGTVWILEVGHMDSDFAKWPAACMNKLIWEAPPPPVVTRSGT